MNAKDTINKLLLGAEIQVNGPNDFDPQVFNENLYRRVLKGGSLALGESYMEGWWDAKSLDKFFYKIFSSQLNKVFALSWSSIFSNLKSLLFNFQKGSRSFIIGEKHYDIGNDLYKAMLGKTLAYSCGYWKKSNNLDEAQEAKFNLICKKIGLKKGDEILDIGCGWGSFLKFASENYGIRGVGITVSKEQIAMAQKICKNLPLEFKLQDYRKLNGRFDHIVSIGMFEHVGVKNYRTYMMKARDLLKDDGLFLLHTIGSNKSSISGDPWLSKYIFPNSSLPSIAQIAKSIEGLFVVEDCHNFGSDYDRTLMAWFNNFEKHWPSLKEKYSEKFYRMWKYYLLSCAGNFRARSVQLWQIVLSKKGVPGGYKSIR
jgi:cyclopropane-fatty-acyl-phospholipid synthase